ncbi:MAG: aspartate carbamoyltransferase catalytic subunit [Candidatus Delongbacteria bacterium]|nr:aspartate carbamoyltransferase catalytic subunit [Candidatus Delongbacteria bacterium]
MDGTLSQRHLLGLQHYTAADIGLILDTASSFREVLERPIKKVPTLRGITVVNLFFENSTRTRISFEMAEKRLSCDTVNFSSSTSSTQKGETLRDTAANIEAMKIDAVVMRHSCPGSPGFLADCLDSIIINAGDGAHEHPTQALLDLMSIRSKHPGGFKDLRVTLAGDILHSRVALSNIYALRTLGAKVQVCGPATLIPRAIGELGVTVFHRIEEAIENSDVLNVLRIQKERHTAHHFPSVREYHDRYGVTLERLKTHAPNGITIMHPGPINRGVEISSEVADSEYSAILDQVTNGVAVRMAVLYLLLGAETVKGENA